MPKNWNCDGAGPHQEGAVRVLPMGKNPDHGNLILCLNCYCREMAFRRERNRELAADCAFDLPSWETLKVYLPVDMTPRRPAPAPRASLYNVFVRDWWKPAESPGWPNNREPEPNAPREYLAKRVSYARARAISRAYNDTHDPGPMSRKAEFEEAA